MDATLLSVRPNFRCRLTIVFAELALAGLLISLFAPTPFDGPGAKILLVGLVAGWVVPSAGAWAVLTNFTALWMCIAIFRGKRPGLSVALTLLLPVTSPAFWKMLGKTTLETWGPYAWTATLLVGVLAAIMTRFSAAVDPYLLTDRATGDGENVL